MLSLDNAFDDEELVDFDRKARELGPGAEVLDYVGELKLAGVSMAVRFGGDDRTGEAVGAGGGGDPVGH